MQSISEFTSDLGEEEVPPNAAQLIESMRDIGYSLKTAAADIIDNSISAGARQLSVLLDLLGAEPFVAFIDNGCGMSLSELREAMRPGTKGPSAQRSEQDLGRFGLGLKTASFSQCRHLSVASKVRGGTLHAKAWDIDLVKQRNRWLIETPEGGLLGELASKIESQGTVVLWQRLDRIDARDEAAANEAIDEIRCHLSLVFHRFLERPYPRRVCIEVNGLAIEPLDPFCKSHPATSPRPTQLLPGNVMVQAFTIPHHSKMSSADYARSGLEGGHKQNQGFYLYRRERLLLHGSWLGLVRPAATRQLSRVQVDIPNELDAKWRVDIKKSSAEMPRELRRELKKLAEELGVGSTRTYEWKGRRHPLKESWGFWSRVSIDGSTTYAINGEHPEVKRLRSQLVASDQRLLDDLLGLFSASLPLDQIFYDMGHRPADVRAAAAPADALERTMRGIVEQLRLEGKSLAEARKIVETLPMFEGRELVVDATFASMRGGA
jgi:hypothetical protein